MVRLDVNTQQTSCVPLKSVNSSPTSHLNISVSMAPSTPQNANQESSHHKKPSRPYQQQSLKSKESDPLPTSFKKLFRGWMHSKSSSQPVIPQDNNANLKLYEGTEYPDLVIQSLPSSSRDVEQGIGATLQDPHHSSTSGNTRIVTTDQQNVNSRDTEHIGKNVHRHG
ncbi:hypothetical protein M378DRAFT_579195 [Amanita muscaria Koide BX008]|uniref:Uncharacterized protein n=1 Tax=Amanita muscaria (strain Koide BX008) TaxID=946122 RepID=A0A0C2X764_AMAMK|nr:hypothetical protein M378DRAFT_579195 [Amanita muscaria Koide BX008]